MKAPEHYNEALRLLAGHVRPADGTHRETRYSASAEDIAKAQVHAILALATAIGDMLTEFSEHLADHHRDDP